MKYRYSIFTNRVSHLFTLLVSLIVFGSTFDVGAQSAKIINDGANITTTNGVYIYTQGEVRNQVNGTNNGTITNDGNIVTIHGNPANAAFINLDPNSQVQGDGNYDIFGDWVNNGRFFGDSSTVDLYGPDQLITGDSISSYFNLYLTGGGTKTMTLDAEVNNVLDLNDRELDADTSIMYVLNTDPTAIQRTGASNITLQGFVSSDSSAYSGLSRAMDQVSSYLYPMGDSVSTGRYRPLEITPSSSNPHSFKVRFANYDPTLDGYDITNKQAGIGVVNGNWYQRIDRTSGTDPADVNLFYDNAAEDGDMMTHWETNWEDMGNVNNTVNASPTLSEVEKTGWNDYSPVPFNIAASPFSVDAGPDDTICSGSTAQLSANTTGGTGPFGYNWTPGDSVTDSTIANPFTVPLTSTTTFIVTAYDSATGTTSLPDTVVIHVVPQVQADAGGPFSLCAGDSVQLGGRPTAFSGTSPYSYSWTNAGDLDSSDVAGPYASPDSDTTFTVTVTDANGCIDSSTATVTVDPIPTVSFSGLNSTYCETVDSIDVTGNQAPDGIFSGTDVIDHGDGTATLAPSGPGSYTVTYSYTDGNGCTAQDAQSTTIQSAPVADDSNIDITHATCGNNNGSITGITVSGGDGSYTYEWLNSGGTVVNTSTTTTDLTNVAPDDYTFTVTDGNGCVDTTGPYTINMLPQPVADAGADAVICTGDTVQVGGSPTASGGGSPYDYAWNNASTLDDSTLANPDAFPTSTTDYIVIVTDTNGCTDEDTMTVTVNPLPSVSFTGLNSSYCESVGTITVTGNQAPDGTFSGTDVADNGDGTADFTPSAPGSYSIYYTYTDGNGCTNVDTQSTTINDDPALDTTNYAITDAICGNPNGEVTGITASGGDGSYTFEWSDGSGTVVSTSTTTADLTGQPAGTYSLIVTDGNGCTDSSGVYTINSLPQPVADAGSDVAICTGDTTQIGGSPTGSNGGSPYDYAWNNASTLDDSTLANPNAFPTSTTEYIVIVTDTNGCTDQDTMTLTVNPLPAVSFTGLSSPYCEDVAQDTLTGNQAPGGTFTGTGITDNGNGTAFFDPATAGTYDITYTYTNGNGCTDSSSQTVTVNDAPVIDTTGMSITDASCGNSDGSITGIAVTGGTGSYTFEWENSSGTIVSTSTTTADLNNQPSGSYTLIVTDGNGCSSIGGPFSINDLGGPTASAGPDVTICDNDTVTIGGSPTGSGGTGTLTYAWNNAGTMNDSTLANPDVFPSATTTYQVTVIDANGCGSSDNITVTVNGLPVVSVLGADSSYCEGGPLDTLSGNQAPSGTFTGDVTDLGNGTATFDPVAPGDYYATYTYTDGNGCTNSVTDTLTVNDNPVINASSVSIVDATCGNSDGSISGITVSGGSGSYTYDWSDGSGSVVSTSTTTADLTNQPAGTYTLTVIDGNGCSDVSSTFTINDLAGPTADAGSDLTVCSGDTVQIGGTPTASGGSSPYTYAWDSAATLNDSTLANPDAFPSTTTDYIVTVTDDTGCIDQDTMTLIVNPLPVVSFTGLNSPYCQNTTVDTLTGNQAPGGTFTGTGITDFGNGTAGFDPATAGTYDITYTFTNGNGCTDSTSQTVTVNDAPVIDTVGMTVTNATCGNADGSISGITVTGGTGSYTYEWTDGSGTVVSTSTTTADLSAQPSGSYTLTATDGNGCSSASTPISINDQNGPTADAGLNDTICASDTVTIGGVPTASGGVSPYDYAWNNSGTVNDTTLANPDVYPTTTTTYEVTVTDDNGCTGTDNVTITVNPLPVVSFSGLDSAYCEGLPLDTINGNNAPSGTFSGTGVTDLGNGTATFDPSTPGTYGVTYSFTNANGCTDSYTDSVKVLDGPVIDDSGISITNATCGNNDGGITGITVSGGASPYSHVWTDASDSTWSTSNSTADLNNAGSGNYDLTVTDTNGCADSTSAYTISDMGGPTVDAGLNDTICAGDSVQLGGSPTATGGASPYSYSWTPSGSLSNDTVANPMASPSVDTTYDLTVTDDNSCTGTGSVSIVVNAPATVNAGADDTICEGSTFTTAGTFGGSASSVNWSTNGDGTFSNGGTVNATYTPGSNDITNGSATLVITTDDPAGSCGSISDTLVLTVNPADDATFSYGQTTYCISSSDPSPTVATAGGTFSEPSGDLVIDGATGVIDLSASTIGGPYTITYATSGPCPDTATFDVSITDQLDATITAGGPYCAYDAMDTLSSVDGGGVWSGTGIVDTNNGVFDPSSAGAGTYSIVYTISGNCGDSDTVQVTVEPGTNANAGADVSLCPGDSTTITATGGVSYSWNTGDSTSSITVTTSGTYIVTANNAANCPSSDTVQVSFYSNSSVYAGDDEGDATAGETIVIDVHENDTGDAASIAIISGPSSGNASVVNGEIEYTAEEGYNGSDVIDYEICNGNCTSYCDTATVTITVEEGIPELYIPNGVSPNGDGYNDAWVIDGLEAYPDHKMMIFNRWGDVVFSAKPYNNNWKGQVNEGGVNLGGNGVVEGTYYFILELGEDEEPVTGFVELKK